MKKFEYNEIYARDTTWKDYVKQAGEEGWEVYHLEIFTEKAANDYGDCVPTKMYDIYLKREISE